MRYINLRFTYVLTYNARIAFGQENCEQFISRRSEVFIQ